MEQPEIEMIPETSQTLSNYPNHETSVLWDEAGFIPPPFFRMVIEYLHRLNNDDLENIYDKEIYPCLICEEGKKTISDCSEYIFTDRERMYSFAGDMDIPAGEMNDTEIADLILCRLINEYSGENRLTSGKTETQKPF